MHCLRWHLTVCASQGIDSEISLRDFTGCLVPGLEPTQQELDLGGFTESCRVLVGTLLLWCRSFPCKFLSGLAWNAWFQKERGYGYDSTMSHSATHGKQTFRETVFRYHQSPRFHDWKFMGIFLVTGNCCLHFWQTLSCLFAFFASFNWNVEIPFPRVWRRWNYSEAISYNPQKMLS